MSFLSIIWDHQTYEKIKNKKKKSSLLKYQLILGNDKLKFQIFILTSMRFILE